MRSFGLAARRLLLWGLVEDVLGESIEMIAITNFRSLEIAPFLKTNTSNRLKPHLGGFEPYTIRLFCEAWK